MLKRRSSVRNCCRIESSNRLKSIFIKFNCFIFFKYFCKGGPGPGAPLHPPLFGTALLCTIHPLLHGLSIRRYPMSPLTSSLGEFLGYWDLLWYPGPMLVSIAFPFAFYISVFFHSLF